ncbi:MAG: four helix bundle protein [Devosia sp. 67-54]|uniref:four helix bundle protein n=1 Tax=unclassified Devosia TaxID=196773 RepID=UPI00095FA925|nr:MULTISPECIES: four helix bundle protein [unclassified Devosia]MBN9304272.1 four helix bundle protein [Devosia sp.]OJX18087.1 MAG: four helix bundle protein [Devosia sp. 67-54]
MVTQTNEIRDYRDLIVWQEAMEIAEMVYSLTRAFPREEAYGLVSQMRRSAVSIPSNIAEGFGRAQRRSFVQFLRIAQGSLKELETQAQLAARIGMLDVEGLSDLLDRSERLGRRLVQFVRSLERGASQ